MPDISIPCPECGREYRLSEYATVDGISCLTCGARLQKPRYHQGTGGLKLKSLQNILPPPLPSSGPAMAAVGIAPSGPAAAAHPVPHRDIHHEEEAHDAPKWLSLIIAAIVLCTMLGYQYFADDLGRFETAYLWGRNILAVGSYLMVVLMAFQDGLGPGALCLVIPPYSLFYASASIESALVRGVFYGTVIGLAAEVYFIPESSLAMAAGAAFGQLVEWVDGLMVTASEAPR